MSRYIRVLQTDNDFENFKSLLNDLKLKIYTFHVQELSVEQIKLSLLTDMGFRILPENVLPVVSRAGKYNIFSDDFSFIEFNPCLTKNKQISEGAFILHKGAHDKDGYIELNNIFSVIKKRIRKEYTLSDDKSCYIGCDFMNRWQNREISAEFILKKEEIKLVHENIERETFLNFLKECYELNSVIDCKKNIKESNFLAICLTDTDLVKMQLGRMTRITFDSNCVFLSLEKKYDSVIIDTRLIFENKSAKYIFSDIKSYVKKNYKFDNGVYIKNNI